MSYQSFRPSIAQLRAFLAIARLRHFRSAAAEMGISQPSLSQALSALEHGLGVHLIERSTRRVLVTGEGEMLLPLAEQAVRAMDEFVLAARGVGADAAGPLRLGIIPTSAPYLVGPLLAALAETHPEVIPTVVEDQTHRLVDALRTGRIDVALLALPAESSGVAEIPVYREDFVLVLPPGHPLAGARDVATATLADMPLLLLDEGHCLRDQTLDLCRRIEISPPRTDTRAASLATVVQCVAGGLGVTLLPRSAVAIEADHRGLAVAEFAGPRPGRRMGLVFRSSSPRRTHFETLAGLLRDVVVEARFGEALQG